MVGELRRELYRPTDATNIQTTETTVVLLEAFAEGALKELEKIGADYLKSKDGSEYNLHQITCSFASRVAHEKSSLFPFRVGRTGNNFDTRFALQCLQTIKHIRHLAGVIAGTVVSHLH